MKKCLGLLLALVLMLSTEFVNAFAPTNFFTGHDYPVRLPALSKKQRSELWNGNLKFGAMLEIGDRKTGKNWDKKRVNVLQINNPTESYFDAIKKPVKDDEGGNGLVKEIEILEAKIQALRLVNGLDVDEDGIPFGDIRFTADFKGHEINLFGQFRLPFDEFMPGDMNIQLHLPIVYRKINDVNFETGFGEGDKNIKTAMTKLIKTEVFENIFEKPEDAEDARKILKLKNEEINLDFNDWKKTGVGDMSLLVDWQGRYKQDKDMLNNVFLRWKFGVTVPSGSQKDEDRVFSMPLGNDGAWGIPFGMGIELDFIRSLRAGVDVDFLYLFDKTRDRRMKTSEDQTEFMLLNKGRAIKEHGLTWKFHLFLRAFQIVKGFSAGVAYQYFKRDDDRLCPTNNNFDLMIVNSARSLKETIFHNLLFKLNYDCFDKDGAYWSFAPQVSLFAKVPLDAKKGIDNYTFGGQLAVAF
jgi:hypothetical protein